MKRRQFLVTAAITGVTVIAGCSEGSNEEPNAEDGAPNTEEPTANDSNGEEKVIIEEHSFEVIEEYSSDAVEDDYGVVGMAKNNSDERLDIFLSVRFYDKDDVQVSDFTTSAEGVEPGGKFKFEAPLLDASPNEVERYEIGWEVYEN